MSFIAMGAWAKLVRFWLHCLSKPTPLLFVTVTLLDTYSVIAWVVRALQQSLATVSPLINTVTPSFANYCSSS